MRTRTCHSRSLSRLRRSVRRRGSVLVLAVAMLVVILAFAAFSIDVGYITLSKAQLQTATDASALSAARELSRGLGPRPELTPGGVAAVVRDAAVSVAGSNRMADTPAVHADGPRDVRLGQILWDSSTNSTITVWGVSPYNAVEVTLRRIEAGESSGDRPLSLFLAPVIGHETAEIQTRAVCGLLPGVGFRPTATQNSDILPITYDLVSWQQFVLITQLTRRENGGPAVEAKLAVGSESRVSDAALRSEPQFVLVKKGDEGDGDGDGDDDGEGILDDPYGVGFGEDNYAYDPATGTVTRGQDGIPEFDLYPGGGSNLSSGNRGLLRLGDPGASTLDRQISQGVNQADLAGYNGEINFENGPLDVAGNPGLKTSLQSALGSIVGQTRALPIFTTVEGNGSNAEYTLVQFIGVRILAVNLSGNNKYVIVQPGVVVDATVIPADIAVEDATLFTAAKLYQ
ncbi:MAG: Tad domain-containing protein [Planctomycetes bacterium]|nr:Tad domain-containing protein [Planctomycetota bacterium]